VTKWKAFFGRNEKRILFLLIGLILFFFLFISADEVFDWKKIQMEPVEQILPMQDGQAIERRLTLSTDGALRAIDLQFFAYGRENRAAVFVELLEDGQIRNSWELNAAVLVDYMTYTFELHKTFVPMEGVDYCIRVREEFSGENGVGLCADGEGEVVYGLTYRDQARRAFALLAMSFVYLIVCLWVLLGGSESRLRALLLSVCVLSCVWFIPPLGRDDESAHLQRAYQISMGNWISPYVELSDPRETGGFAGRDVFPNALSKYGPLDRNVELNEEDASKMPVFFGYYSPVGYFPHALGMYAAHCFTNKVEFIYRAGCISGAIFNLLICFLALSCMPFGKNVLFTIMMFPPSIEQMSGITGDGPLFAVACLFLAYVLRLAYEKAHVSRWDLLVLAGLTVFIGLCKSAYVCLLLLLFLIPREKFGEKWSRVWKTGLLLLGVALDLLWTAHAGKYLYEMVPGVDKKQQILFILSNPFEFYKNSLLLIQTCFDWLVETLTEYSYLGFPAGPPAIAILFLVLLVSELRRCECVPVNVGGLDKLLCLIACLGCLALTIVAGYITFMPVGGIYISIGGRYLLPILGCFCVFLLLPFTHRSDRADAILPVTAEEHQQTCGLEISKKTDSGATYLYLLLLGGNGMAMFQILQKWTETIWH